MNIGLAFLAKEVKGNFKWKIPSLSINIKYGVSH